jgi:hypothetical protein
MRDIPITTIPRLFVWTAEGPERVGITDYR